MSEHFRPLKLYDFHGKVRMYNIPVFHKGQMKIIVDLINNGKTGLADSVDEWLECFTVKFDTGETAGVSECEFIENIEEYQRVVKILHQSQTAQNA